MADSSIEWTEKTWNPVVGCEKVSPGCAHCYAETMAARLKAMALKDIADGKDPGRKRHYIDAIDDKGRWSGKLIPVPEALADPLGWKKPRMIFVNSMSDLFHESVPDEFIDKVFAVMSICPQHTFQVLTKRAERMYHYMEDRDHQYLAEVTEFIDGPLSESQRSAGWLLEVYRDAEGLKDGQYEYHGTLPLPNVWLGVSAEDHSRAEERVHWLLRTPAAIRFVSAEPLIGDIDFEQLHLPGAREGLCYNALTTNDDRRYFEAPAALDWIIVGGESGHGARPCEIPWIRAIVQQCNAAAVPVFVKQLGGLPAAPNDEVADWFDECGHLQQQPTASRQGEVGRIFGFRDKKGGDMGEFPSDLRVRHFPKV